MMYVIPVTLCIFATPEKWSISFMMYGFLDKELIPCHYSVHLVVVVVVVFVVFVVVMSDTLQKMPMAPLF